MNLYLVRHGTANHPELDPLMGLSKLGKEEVQVIASKLSNMNDVNIKKIFHSTKKRAKETAEILNSHLNVTNGVEEVKGLSPNDDINTWAEKLEHMESNIMLVGHLPYMPTITRHLTGKTEEINFVNACTVCLSRENAKWSINWIKTPTNL